MPDTAPPEGGRTAPGVAAPGAVTELLHAWNSGGEEARERLMSVVYRELRVLAASYLRKERPNHTLQPTALVHEAFLRLVESTAPWRDRAHFFGVAAQAMRRILVDHARKRQSAKRGQAPVLLTLDEAIGLPGRNAELVALDDALRTLSALDPRQERIVELRCFGGLTIDETAEALELSPATIKREWATAKAWMARELKRQGPPRAANPGP
jgi:RNA polymerase sigma factor (TIGR02999 family)